MVKYCNSFSCTLDGVSLMIFFRQKVPEFDNSMEISGERIDDISEIMLDTSGMYALRDALNNVINSFEDGDNNDFSEEQPDTTGEENT